MLYKIIRPIFFAINPETVHDAVFKLGSMVSRHPFFLRLHENNYHYENPALETEVFGLKFKNPVGLAPGYDKKGACVPFLTGLGFGFVEVGTVTPEPQPGNPRPRLFRMDQDLAIINRMGFNSIGQDSVVKNLERTKSSVVLGINLGKNKSTPNEQAVKDYKKGFARLSPFADYVVINVSSPNTPGLRELQGKAELREIIVELQKMNSQTSPSIPPHALGREGRVPLLIKIAPDLNNAQLDDIVVIAKETELNGIVATNTIATPDGGLSGAPLRKRATEVIGYLYKKLQGQIPIIGVGGVFSAEDAYEKIRAGASLVQIYTGLVYEGPGLVKKINQGLVELLKKDGFSNISQAVGADYR